MTLPLPSQKMLNAFLRYDDTSGKLFWRERQPSEFQSKATGRGAKSSEAIATTWNKRFANQEAGSPFKNGYLYLTIGGRKYLAHRLIWKMIDGTDAAEVDHITGDKLDNRLSNLRAVSHRDNGRNMKRSSRNTSGVTGVAWNGARRKWCARIFVDGCTIYLGLFWSFDEAVAVRRAAEALHRFHANHGRAPEISLERD
jgi:hypothetical protein